MGSERGEDVCGIKEEGGLEWAKYTDAKDEKLAVAQRTEADPRPSPQPTATGGKPTAAGAAPGKLMVLRTQARALGPVSGTREECPGGISSEGYVTGE